LHHQEIQRKEACKEILLTNDASAYDAQIYNIMLGSGLKLGINSNTKNQNETDILFPKGTWCDVYNSSLGCITNEDDSSIN
jgi:hypothetical protein